MSRPSRRQLALAVLNMLAERPAEDVAHALAAYLIAERRTKEVDLLLRDIEAMRFTNDGVLEVTATSAHELSAGVKEQIRGLLSANQVTIHERRDPHIVGGAKIRSHDMQLDLSVHAKLAKLKHLAKGT